MSWPTITSLLRRVFSTSEFGLPAASADQPVLQASGLGVSRGSRDILSGINLRIHAGEKVGLLGPNGSGKTSLLRVLAGMVAPDEGSVQLHGRELSKLPDRHRARLLALVAQEEATELPFTARDVLLLGRTAGQPDWHPHRRCDHAAVEDLAQRWELTGLLDRSLQEMSGGERRRVLLARAFAQRSALLLLDEPTNHLDLRHQHQLLDHLRASSETTVMALHDLDLAASYCTRVLVLHDGHIVADGHPSTVLTQELIRQVWQVQALPVHLAGQTRLLIEGA
ncbi:ABC transporter ATP-binding protein [Micrococcoides hystricis]|uniref:ABC transporter ATP-binding protein n=1 Tax=Micrococcoides hystricis TaxID=1572761 RepID=A0ABV6PF27_9MICC